MAPSPRAANVPAPSDDAAALAEKQKQLDAINNQIADDTSKAKDLTADVKALQARIAEIQNATKSFDAAATAQQKELDSDKQLIEQKSAMASAGITKDQSDNVSKVVAAVDKDISAKSDKVTKAQQAADDAAKDLNAATAEAKAKREAYAALQQAPKDTDTKLKAIKALLAQASVAEAQGDIVSMYFLINEAATALKGVSIMSADDYAAKLKTAQADDQSAQSKLPANQAASDAAVKDLGAAQTDLATATSKRQDNILAELKKPPAPVVPAPVVPAPVVPAPVVPAPAGPAGVPPPAAAEYPPGQAPPNAG
jgi:flagellar biosynthesis chaperone FliJ